MKKAKGNYHGLIIASEYTTCMDSFKPLLSLGDDCILQSVVRQFKDAGIDKITVVVGYQSERLIPMLERMNVRIVENDRYGGESLFEPMRLGVASLPPDTTGVILCSANLPFLRPYSIQYLVECDQTWNKKSIMPTYHGKVGQIVLFDRCLFWLILNYRDDGGIYGLLDRIQDEVGYVELPDPGILEDYNLLGDYHKLKNAYANRDCPSRQICEDILNFMGTPESVKIYSRNVEKTALELTDILNRQVTPRLNRDYISAAALLYNMAKGQPNHLSTAVKILEHMRYEKIAQLIASCEQAPQEGRMDEKYVLYLAIQLTNQQERRIFNKREKEESFRFLRKEIEKKTGCIL